MCNTIHNHTRNLLNTMHYCMIFLTLNFITGMVHSWQYGGLDVGPQCHLSNLRHGIVPCHYF